MIRKQSLDISSFYFIQQKKNNANKGKCQANKKNTAHC